MNAHQAIGAPVAPASGDIAVVDEDGASVLRLRGEIDCAVVAAYDASPLPHRRPTVIDASGVTFLDCRGLRLLMRETRAGRGSGHRPVLRCPARVVRRLIGVTGTEELFTITP